MSTPTGPKTPGAPPSDATSRPSLDQTFLGVAPPARPPAQVAQQPLVAPAAPAPASSPPPATPSRNAIVAAPVISVSSKTAAAPITPRVVATPARDERSIAPRTEPPAPSASEPTLMHPTPRAVGTPASPSPLRSAFPKPEPYAIPPRAGDGPRNLGAADRTALSADYLRAAREAALGRDGAGDMHPKEPAGGAAVPSQRVLGNRAAFSTTPASRAAHEQPRDDSPPSFTQQSLGSEPPPAPLPALPAAPASDRSPPAAATRFEPVPAARTHLSDRGTLATSGQSLAHISVDWSPEQADRVRSAAPAPQSRAARLVWVGVGALVLIVLGFFALGGPLRRLAARVAGRAIETEVERGAPAAPASPSVTTLSNRPSGETAPADSVPAGNAAPPTPEARPAP